MFIAANIVDEELIRGPWGSRVVELVELLGRENVFLSIYENDRNCVCVKIRSGF